MFSFFRPTVAKITASLDRMVAKLEAHADKSAALASYHRAVSEVHDAEAFAAARVKAKIAELLA